jgi:hypothetical protein
MSGVENEYSKIIKHYDNSIDLFTIYSRFHGKIVEFSKSKKDIQELT